MGGGGGRWGGGRWGEGHTNNSNKTKEAVGRGKRDQGNNNNIRGRNVSEIKAKLTLFLVFMITLKLFCGLLF